MTTEKKEEKQEEKKEETESTSRVSLPPPASAPASAPSFAPQSLRAFSSTTTPLIFPGNTESQSQSQSQSQSMLPPPRIYKSSETYTNPVLGKNNYEASRAIEKCSRFNSINNNNNYYFKAKKTVELDIWGPPPDDWIPPRSPICKCMLFSARLRVKKKNNNHGRYFYACNNDRDAQCKFFEWAEAWTEREWVRECGRKYQDNIAPLKHPFTIPYHIDFIFNLSLRLNRKSFIPIDLRFFNHVKWNKVLDDDVIIYEGYLVGEVEGAFSVVCREGVWRKVLGEKEVGKLLEDLELDGGSGQVGRMVAGSVKGGGGEVVKEGGKVYLKLRFEKLDGDEATIQLEKVEREETEWRCGGEVWEMMKGHFGGEWIGDVEENNWVVGEGVNRLVEAYRLNEEIKAEEEGIEGESEEVVPETQIDETRLDESQLDESHEHLMMIEGSRSSKVMVPRSPRRTKGKMREATAGKERLPQDMREKTGVGEGKGKRNTPSFKVRTTTRRGAVSLGKRKK
ncbi:hypothetical protein TL16_g08341 [Triparma laevis f. inornata]|uniref:GRF-type domain-containing protein n=1 Tax=Triparma laevis f. inornata TaxID=1714386 RepID=A0A9W7EIJ5_9STRA|nr:hypothetical protein TL16_g08341 [Triparma laevis f. inornata]